jgi:hypothetical protein
MQGVAFTLETQDNDRPVCSSARDNPGYCLHMKLQRAMAASREIFNLSPQ